jgi:putative two-component system response regulator
METTPSRATILVVDDEPVIRELESNTLGELGHQVIEAGNGMDALQLAREHRPDLMLVDIMMPGVSGIDVCRQLRQDKHTRDIRIIVVSGADAKQALEESIIAGADDFLAKPIDTLELMVRVRSLLRVRNIQDAEKRVETYIKHLQSMRSTRKPQT